MKTYHYIRTMLIAALLFLSQMASAQSYPFDKGETLKYTLNYKWGISADIADITFALGRVDDASRPYFHIRLDASTKKFFDGVFKVRDVYETKFAVKDLSPIWFARDIHEGNYWCTNNYEWSDDAMKLHAKVTKSTRPPVDTIMSAEEVIHDVISLVYLFRSSDINSVMAGGKEHFLVAMDRNLIDVTMTYLGKENKKVAETGTFSTLKFAINLHQRKGQEAHGKDAQVTMSSGSSGSTIYIWVTDDGNLMPVYFTVPITVGSVNGRLTGYSGLRYKTRIIK